MEWTQDKLWELRQQITLNSLFISDYENFMGVDAHVVSDFFDSYVDYLEEQCEDKYCRTPTMEEIFAEDNPDNLWNWFGCYETNPLPTT
jgi:hypothetical protein